MNRTVAFSLTRIMVITLLFGLLYGPSVLAQEEGEETQSFKEMSSQERYEQFREQFRQMNAALQDDPDHDVLKETIITGNQIRVLLTNQGSISTPDADRANADLVWPAGPSGLGYAYEFGPMVAAEVIGENGDTLHIVSEGFLSTSDGDFEPGTANRWGWEPKLGFSDPASNEVATFSDLDRNFDGKPDSWPESWFNETLGRYVWPAFLGDDATTPDEEVYYVMDDLDNAEFDYVPFPGQPDLRGLGMELQVRIFQFNNPLAEDIIFLVYTVTNVSQKTINKVYLGMFGDPHVGGPGDFSDDNAGFISAFDDNFEFCVRNMLFASDEDGRGDGNKIPGLFGYRFLESPGINNDNFDNDNDGLLDESQFNDAGAFVFNSDFGVYREPGFHWSGDEDGDWVEDFDDVGVDGIAGTGDFGEGDGKPNQLFYLDANNNSMLDPGELTSERREMGMRFFGGEPNFGFLDIAESDQLGLTSFNALQFGGGNRPKNDELMWDLMSTPNQRPGDPPPDIEQEADNVFIYGSGPFTLQPGESQRFSIALMLGQDFDDLLSNACISQQVFEADYRFAQAPRKPNLVAVPGKGKVTLYWDDGAEDSFDPFVARANPDSLNKGFDFEGYRIYRSEDFSFNDTQTITDSRGVPFLSVPLRQQNGLPAQFDLINQYQGLSDIEYAGRGVRYDLGRNTGLVHVYTDSVDIVDGVTYFYAVTSYDHGDENADIAPTESQRTIQRDAVTRLFSFDVNTAMVVPGQEAIGYQPPELINSDGNFANQITGNATGSVAIRFVDPFEVKDNKTYDIFFEDVEVDSVTTSVGYSVIDPDQSTVDVVSRGTAFVSLGVCCPLLDGSVVVRDAGGSVVDTSRYQIDIVNSRIRGTSSSAFPVGQTFTITFQLKPISSSLSLNEEDDNPVFDGVKLIVRNEETALDPISTEGGRTGFKTINTNTNFRDANTTVRMAGVGNAQPYPSDFEFRFVNYDTTASGDLVSPADSAVLSNVKTPFRIIDVETGMPIQFFINEVSGFRNGRWDWQESVVLIRPDAEQVTETTYEVAFSPPSDTIMVNDSTIQVDQQDPVYPGDGDVFLVFSRKPFKANDQYSFTTKAARFEQDDPGNALDDVIVVPNPYIAYSSGEIAGVRTGDRDDRQIQFRNLPPQCTIRIYTIVGELIDTIEKNDNRDYTTWNLLTFESQDIAYGVYIYHVDAPGIGTKIGRFAVIK